MTNQAKHPRHPIPPVVSRRTFIEKLGLGAGAVILSPIAQALVSEARGQVVDRKIAYFMLVGNGIHPDWNFTPKELLPPGVGSEGTQFDVKSPLLDGPTSFTLPPMFKAMEAYRSRMLLIDGLANKIPEPSHSTNFAALSCVCLDGRNAEDAPPGGITIDQYLANGKLGASTPRKSILVGISTAKTPTATGTYGIFAAGKNMPVPQYQSANALFMDVFGKVVTAAPATGGMPGPNLAAMRQRLLFDGLRGDIARLQGAVAGTERQKLDTYLAAIADYEKNQQGIAAVAASCGSPGATPAATLGVEDSLLSMTALASLALTCGITNVVGVSCGCGPSHDTFPELPKLTAALQSMGVTFAKGSWSGVGHEMQPVRQPAMDAVYNWLGGMMARTIDALSKIKVGDKTLWDNSVFVFTSENGEEHHAKYQRWPVAVFGNAGGKLKADGRFLRFPARGSKGYRSLGDFYCSIATAVGIPTNDFGKGGVEPVVGPLELIMA
jgi:hypothetical protein